MSKKTKRPHWDPRGEYNPEDQPTDPDSKPWITDGSDPEPPSKELLKLRARAVKHARAYVNNMRKFWMMMAKMEKDRDIREPLAGFMEQSVFYANKVIERVNKDDSLYRRIICPVCKGRTLLEPTRNKDGSIKHSNKCKHCFAGFMPQEDAEKLQEGLSDGTTDTD